MQDLIVQIKDKNTLNEISIYIKNHNNIGKTQLEEYLENMIIK